jgi:hypothetical protein
MIRKARYGYNLLLTMRKVAVLGSFSGGRLGYAPKNTARWLNAATSAASQHLLQGSAELRCPMGRVMAEWATTAAWQGCASGVACQPTYTHSLKVGSFTNLSLLCAHTLPHHIAHVLTCPRPALTSGTLSLAACKAGQVWPTVDSLFTSQRVRPAAQAPMARGTSGFLC